MFRSTKGNKNNNLEENDLNISRVETDSSRGKQANEVESRKDKMISELQEQLNAEKSMKEEAIKEKANLEKRIDELEKQKNLEKDELKERIVELEKIVDNEKSLKETSEKKKDEVLKYLELQITCPVCLMIPRTKRIPICRNGHTTCETCKR